MVIDTVLSTIDFLKTITRIDKLCVIYDFVLEFCEYESYPLNLKTKVENHSQSLVDKIEISMEETAWVDYLKIRPVSLFSKGLLKKIFYRKIMD